MAPLCYVGLVQNAEVAELAEKALDMWPTTGHPPWSEVAAAAANALFALEELDRARVRAQEAVDAGSPPVGAALAHAALAGVSSAADHDPVAALVHLDRADGAAVAGGFEPIRSDLMNLRAEFLAQAGRLEEAFAVAEQALSMAVDQGNRYTGAEARYLLGMLHVRSQPAGTAVAGGCAGRIASRRILVRRRWRLRGLAVLCAEEGDVATAAGQFLDVLDRFICDGFLAERWTTVAAGVLLLVKAGRREAAAVLLTAARSAGAAVSPVNAPGLKEAADELATELTSSQLTLQRRRAPISCSRWHGKNGSRFETACRPNGANGGKPRATCPVSGSSRAVGRVGPGRHVVAGKLRRHHCASARQ